MCNNEEERQRYLDLAVKEENIERAVRENVINITIIIYLKEFIASDWLTAMCEIVMSYE